MEEKPGLRGREIMIFKRERNVFKCIELCFKYSWTVIIIKAQILDLAKLI